MDPANNDMALQSPNPVLFLLPGTRGEALRLSTASEPLRQGLTERPTSFDSPVHERLDIHITPANRISMHA